jgi:hypothetical protein
MKIFISKSGSTIVELLLYMGLLSIFIILLFNLFAQIISTQTRSASVSLVNTNGNFLMTKLTHDINQADDIITPPTIDSTASAMILKIGSTNATYAVSAGRLTLTDSTGTYNINDVNTTFSDFIVRRLGNPGGKPGLEITFTITSNIDDNSNIKTKTYQTFATLR